MPRRSAAEFDRTHSHTLSNGRNTFLFLSALLQPNTFHSGFVIGRGSTKYRAGKINSNADTLSCMFESGTVKQQTNYRHCTPSYSKRLVQYNDELKTE